MQQHSVKAGQITVSAKDRRKAIYAASIGNFVEWFDFGFYGYLAVTIGAVFFGSDDPVVDMLGAFAVFGAAFLVRPLGAIYFGAIGDRIGRNRVLAITILIMSSATFLVGVLPGHASIGIAAPVLLLVLRLVQGFAAGGEPGGAATFLSEYARNESRGAVVSLWHVSSFLALICSSGLALVLYAVTTEAQMLAWGWRIPFFLALPAGLIGLYIRLRIEDTPEYRKLEAESSTPQSPLREVLRADRLQLVRVFLLAALQQFGFYFVFVYLASYMVLHAELGSAHGTAVTMVAVATAAVTVTAFGALSDRVGRRPVMIGAGVAIAVLALPALMLLRSGSFLAALVAAAVLAIPLAAYMGAAAATYTEAFSTRRRYVGMSLAFGIAAAVFGGTAPYVSTWIASVTGSAASPAFLLIGVAVLSLLALLRPRETARVPLDTI